MALDGETAAFKSGPLYAEHPSAQRASATRSFHIGMIDSIVGKLREMKEQRTRTGLNRSGRDLVPVKADIVAEDAVRRYHLDFTYILAELGRIDDARLSQMAILRARLSALKYAPREADPWPVLVAILKALAENDPPVSTLLAYILSGYENVGRPMLIRAIHQAKPAREECMLSLAVREWIAEGKVEGIAIGRAEGEARGVEARVRAADGTRPMARRLERAHPRRQ